MIICKECKKRITNKNFWTHKHHNYTDNKTKENDTKTTKKIERKSVCLRK